MEGLHEETVKNSLSKLVSMPADSGKTRRRVASELAHCNLNQQLTNQIRSISSLPGQKMFKQVAININTNNDFPLHSAKNFKLQPTVRRQESKLIQKIKQAIKDPSAKYWN